MLSIPDDQIAHTRHIELRIITHPSPQNETRNESVGMMNSHLSCRISALDIEDVDMPAMVTARTLSLQQMLV